MESIGIGDRCFVWVEYRLNLEAMWVMGWAICIGSDDGNWPQVDARTIAEARWQQFKKTVLASIQMRTTMNAMSTGLCTRWYKSWPHMGYPNKEDSSLK
jgi:hypothetical protein